MTHRAQFYCPGSTRSGENCARVDATTDCGRTNPSTRVKVVGSAQEMNETIMRLGEEAVQKAGLPPFPRGRENARAVTFPAQFFANVWITRGGRPSDGVNGPELGLTLWLRAGLPTISARLSITRWKARMPWLAQSSSAAMVNRML